MEYLYEIPYNTEFQKSKVIIAGVLIKVSAVRLVKGPNSLKGVVHLLMLAEN